jgi:endoglycosylceramidase
MMPQSVFLSQAVAVAIVILAGAIVEPCSAVVPQACPRLKPLTGRGVFQDLCTGNEVVVHGVNAVYKGAPWLPSMGAFDARYSLGAEDAEMLQSWGLNGIRLGVMWPGAEPERGYIDESYLNSAAAIATMLGNRSIYTLLDAHQDCLSAKFCGEGAPDWAIPTISSGPDAFPQPIGPAFDVNASGVPSAEDCGKYSWTDYQLTAAGAQGYQMLYNNSNGTRDEFGRFWGAVAARFRNVSHIIGAELVRLTLSLLGVFSCPIRCSIGACPLFVPASRPAAERAVCW